MMPVSVDRYLAPNLMKKTKQSNFITVREAQDNEVKILQNRFCESQAPTEKKNVYLISDILVCGITEYFMKLSGIFWSSLSKQK